MSILYLIATPIGNRDDISFRALEVLFSVPYLYCEDTRKTNQLLDYYQEKFSSILGNKNKPILVSNFEHNEDERAFEILNHVKNGEEVGLVSNAGTPGISDPGYKAVKICRENGIKVIGIPGANAAVLGLSISGLSPDKFIYLGFLPRKKGKQNKIWEDINNSEVGKSVVFYESPFRINKTLENIKEVFGNIEIVIARELTKKFEEVIRCEIDKYLKSKRYLKGEIVVMFRVEK